MPWLLRSPLGRDYWRSDYIGVQHGGGILLYLAVKSEKYWMDIFWQEGKAGVIVEVEVNFDKEIS